MSTVQLDQPVTGGGIRSVNFFNGRLLTGEDLSREQAALRLARLRLGRVAGAGVACGLSVAEASAASSHDAPVLTITPGLAVNQCGDVLELSTETDVSLTRRDAGGGAAVEVVFTDCTPLQPGTYTAGAGVYLLTIAPTKTGEGRAQVSGLGNEEAACNTAFFVDGVRFHLFRLSLPTGLLGDPERLRNRVAHLVYGTRDPRRRLLEGVPFGPAPSGWGLIDDLRALGCLDGTHVPLALVCWTAQDGVRFVDRWAVRRRVVEAGSWGHWSPAVGERPAAEAEATFLQFEDEVAELPMGTSLSTVAAAERFEFLPPVGIVPIAGKGSLGFDADAFLGGQASTDLATTDAALIPALIQESFAHGPIAVGGDETVQRYLVWENEQALEAGQTNRRVLVFARRTLAYRGIARYGRARFGISRFAPAIYRRPT
jgi:hypothetical protein